VVGRDNLDRKCVYVFNRNRDNFQVIKSKVPIVLFFILNSATSMYYVFRFQRDTSLHWWYCNC
jgi:hypothetical protein